MSKLLILLFLTISINANAADFLIQLSPAPNSITNSQVSDGALSSSKITGLDSSLASKADSSSLGSLATKSSLTESDIPSLLSSKISDFASEVTSLINSAITSLESRVTTAEKGRGFSLYLNNNAFSIAQNTNTTIKNWSIQGLESSVFTLNATTGKISVSKTGWYSLHAGLIVSSQLTYSSYANIVAYNAVGVNLFSRNLAGTGGIIGGSVVVYLSAGDVIALEAYQSAVTTSNVSSSSNHTHFSGVYLGE